MELPDHNGLGYPTRPSVSEHHRPRTLQRHHTIQNSDDAYVCWPLLLRSGILPVPTLTTELSNVGSHLPVHFFSARVQHLWGPGRHVFESASQTSRICAHNFSLRNQE